MERLKFTRWLAAAAILALAPATLPTPAEKPANTLSAMTYLIQASDVDTAARRVGEAGGDVTERLPIIRAVAATLTPAQLLELDDLRIYTDAQVSLSGKKSKKAKKLSSTLTFASQTQDTSSFGGGNPLGQAQASHYPTLIGATDLLAAGIDGEGITVAVVDTGIWDKKNGVWERLLREVDTTGPGIVEGYSLNDTNGHGTHVASAMLSSGYRPGVQLYEGVAPKGNLVSVKAFGEDGAGSYLSVIKAIGWIVDHADEYGIRIVQPVLQRDAPIPLLGRPPEPGSDGGLAAGIVVVTSAGNAGPDPMTIGVPGNVPYIITVGAMTDSYTAHDTTDDRLTSFSSVGPTHEASSSPNSSRQGGTWSAAWITTPGFRISTPNRYTRVSTTSPCPAPPRPRPWSAAS